MTFRQRTAWGFTTGALVGVLAGMIGLGGAEFRLPLLVGLFCLATLDAVIFNKAMSLVVVAAALVFRMGAIPLDQVLAHGSIVLNLLAGSLIGAWYAAGRVMAMSRLWLERLILLLLAGLAVLMLAEAWLGPHRVVAPLFQDGLYQWLAGLLAGLGIGAVAALLGVAGGELLIPAIVILYGLDVRLAGSLALLVSFPTMVAGFTRYGRGNALAVLGRTRALFVWMLLGSMLGAAVGGLLVGFMPPRLLLALLGGVLLISAVKTFGHVLRAGHQGC